MFLSKKIIIIPIILASFTLFSNDELTYKDYRLFYLMENISKKNKNKKVDNFELDPLLKFTDVPAWWLTNIPKVYVDITVRRYLRSKKKNLFAFLSRIDKNLRIIQAYDRRRFYDCDYYSKSTTPVAFTSWIFIPFFSSANSLQYRIGLTEENNWPVLSYFYNVNNYGATSRVFMGIRGLDYGIHKSNLTTRMMRMTKIFPESLVYLPDNYIFINSTKNIETSSMMSVCHQRTYKNGVHIGNTWPGFNNGAGWNLINKFLPQNKRIHIISYSNGASPRGQLIETNYDETLDFDFHNILNYKDFLESFNDKTSYKYASVTKIEGMVDIETNYGSRFELWNLIKWINTNVASTAELTTTRKKIYYATCNVDQQPLFNHIKMIRALGLTGVELDNGVVRYSHPTQRIYIDIIGKATYPYHRSRYGNLETQTYYVKNPKVRYRITHTHSSIIEYTIKEYEKMLLDLDLYPQVYSYLP